MVTSREVKRSPRAGIFAFWKCCSLATNHRKPGQISHGHTSSSRSDRSRERIDCRRCCALVDSLLSVVSLKRRSMGPKKVRHSYKKATTKGRSTSKPFGYAQVAWRLSHGVSAAARKRRRCWSHVRARRVVTLVHVSSQVIQLIQGWQWRDLSEYMLMDT